MSRPFGFKHTESTKRKLSIKKKGSKNPQWKGNMVGYYALHEWVRRNFGSPTKCESCKKTGLIGRSIHWANVSGKYKRLRSDWMRLCPKCHRQLFLKNGNSTLPTKDNSRIRRLK